MFATKSRAQVANFSATPTSGCSPLMVAFTDLSTGAGSYDWNFGDGTANSSLAAPQHNYANAGQYTVTLTITGAGGATNTMVKTNYITVFASPQAIYTAVPDTACAGTPITFTSTSIPGDGAITDFTWSFNDGNPPVSGTPSIAHSFVNSTGALKIFKPLLTIIDANGCNSSYTDSVYIYPIPTADLGVSNISSCTVPATVTFSNNSTNTTDFTWDFGDPGSGANNTSTLPTPDHTYNATGNYLVTLTSGVTGCNDVDTMTIGIFPPTASFTASNDSICRFTAVNFTNTSTPSSATLLWNFGDSGSGANNSSTLQNPAHFYTTPGTYTVTLTVTAGSCTSSQTMPILVRPNPLATFSVQDDDTCSTPFNAVFTDTVSNIASWNWTFGDGGTSNLQNPTHTYNTYGNFTVKLVVIDIFGCSDSLTFPQMIHVFAPVVNFTRPDSGCVGSTFNITPFVSVLTGTSVTSYVWNFGDGTAPVSGTGAPTTVSHQFDTVGIFDVTLTITTSDGCTATLTQQGFIRVGTEPVPNFSATPLTICFQQTVQFTDLTPAPVTGWSWSFGDGGGSISQNPSHEYNMDTSTIADPFDVTLTSYYNGCPHDTTIQNMIVVNGPIPVFTFANNCATPLTVPFTNTSGGATSYVWNFGDGSPTETTVSPTHTFPGSGDYNVTLTATSTVTGCTVDTILPVQIRVASAVITASPGSVCAWNSISFSSAGSTDINSLLWTFGEGIPLVNDTVIISAPPFSDVSHMYNRPGFYTVTLNVTDDNGCLVTQTQQVHILGPTADFTASPQGGCAPINVTFTDTSVPEGGAINSWVWNFGGGLPDSTGTSVVTHPYNNAGFFTIRLIVTDVNGCSDTLVEPNFINPSKPDLTITSDTNGCRTIGEAFTATVTSGTPSMNYTWDFGDGSGPTTVVDDSTLSTVHNYLANGVYPVTLLVVDGNGCRDSVSQTMLIHTTPASFTVTSVDSCITDVLNGVKKANVVCVFHSDSNDYATSTSYSWNLTVDSFPNSNFVDCNYTYDVPPGSYDVTLILTNSLGCSDTSTQVGAVVVTGPTGSFSFTPNNGCSPLTVDFTGVATGSNTFAWDFADGNVSNGSTDLTPSHTYYNEGSYTPQFYLGFQLTNSFCYIPTPTTGSIVVTSSIIANIDSTLICITDGGESTVNVNVNTQNFAPYTYTWSPAAFVTQGASDTTFNITTSGQSQYYSVAVGYGVTGCAAYDSVRIDYCPCIDIIDSIPNVFTPNGDVLNDFFEMRSLCYFEQFRIVIFNRWGKKMYESTNPGFKWDGKTDGGTECSEGVYYWIMDTKSGQKHGYLELIRK